MFDGLRRKNLRFPSKPITNPSEVPIKRRRLVKEADLSASKKGNASSSCKEVSTPTHVSRSNGDLSLGVGNEIQYALVPYESGFHFQLNLKSTPTLYHRVIE